MLHAPDPMQRFPDLPSRPQVQFQSKDRLRPGPPEPPAQVIRTALCAEPRKGVLYIFMPPVEALEDYLELVSAVEATAAELDIAVLLEGYEPPKDARLESFRITPDPGVLEVNIHPAASWRELADHTTFLYEQARECRLGTESSCSTAAIAAPAAATTSRSAGRAPPDSPFLRRPDLLASLIAYWHNHPSLSYLFSGLFIGSDQPAPAHRRSAQRFGVRDRALSASWKKDCVAMRAGSSIASSGIC